MSYTLASFPGRIGKRRPLFAHAQNISSIKVSGRGILRSLLTCWSFTLNVEHSDVRACTQGVYSCFVKRLLRDHRQQHPQSSDSLLYICGHITEDCDQKTESIQRYPVSPLNSPFQVYLTARFHPTIGCPLSNMTLDPHTTVI